MACEDETTACKNARSSYFSALANQAQAESEIKALKDSRNVSIGASGGGFALAAGVAAATGPVGWIVGGAILGIGAAAAAVKFQRDLNRARARCTAALTALATAYATAAANCSAACIPPLPTQTCS
jgi:hypothetical protein